MGRVQDTIRTINTTLRTLLMTVLVAAAGVGGYKLYDVYNEPRQQLADKQAELDATASKLQRANEDLSARQKEITELTNQVATKSGSAVAAAQGASQARTTDSARSAGASRIGPGAGGAAGGRCASEGCDENRICRSQ
jgi:ABC-type transporter Mla subunit MlaD